MKRNAEHEKKDLCGLFLHRGLQPSGSGFFFSHFAAPEAGDSFRNQR